MWIAIYIFQEVLSLSKAFIGWKLNPVRNNIFAYLFSIHNTISLSRHKQVCLSGLRFERYFSHNLTNTYTTALTTKKIGRKVLFPPCLIEHIPLSQIKMTYTKKTLEC